MEEDIAANLSESWDFVETNVIYGYPSDEILPGFIFNDEFGAAGEKDIFLYKKCSETADTIGYIEVKDNNSNSLEEDAREQLRRAQKHWNSQGYDFVGGLAVSNNIRSWNKRSFGSEAIKPCEYSTENVPVSAARSSEPEKHIKTDIVRRLEQEGADSAFENVVFGKPLEIDLRGVAKANQHSGHYGQMDAAAFKDCGNRTLICHVEKLDESLTNIEGRLDFTHEFWTDQGYEFQGAVYSEQEDEFYQRDLRNGEWIETPPS
jgi:hypothetical protein